MADVSACARFRCQAGAWLVTLPGRRGATMASLIHRHLEHTVQIDPPVSIRGTFELQRARGATRVSWALETGAAASRLEQLLERGRSG